MHNSVSGRNTGFCSLPMESRIVTPTFISVANRDALVLTFND